MVITLIVVTPYLSYERPELKLTDATNVLSLLGLFTTNSSETLRDQGMDMIINAHPSILYLEANGFVGIDILDKHTNLRSTEIIFVSINCD